MVIFQGLLEKYLNDELNRSETDAFIKALEDPANWTLIEQTIIEKLQTKAFSGYASAQVIQTKFEEMLTRAEKLKSQSAPIVHRVHFLKTTWFRYAAAIIILFGIGGYFWTATQTSQTQVAQIKPPAKSINIIPGGNKAILTLADGRIINLDSAANGQLATQEGAAIKKNADGEIIYDPAGKASAVVYNTMSTPKGGQYQLKLPDGTRVWLNAASSITYPTAFVDNRRVKIKGEVYLEVAPNKLKPFIVDVNEKAFVEVLGTSFNVNSYAEEKNIKATLIAGSIKVKQADKSVVLQPGQQAQVLDAQPGILVKSAINLEQALAWKNGIFDFNGTDLYTVMRQLERWYDIKVEYRGAVSNIIFKGKMYRNVNLADVLDMLKRVGVRFEMNGQKLVIY